MAFVKLLKGWLKTARITPEAKSFITEKMMELKKK